MEAAAFFIAHGGLKLIEPNAGVDRKGLSLHQFETDARERKACLSMATEGSHLGGSEVNLADKTRTERVFRRAQGVSKGPLLPY